jgi:hypothetical protein
LPYVRATCVKVEYDMISYLYPNEQTIYPEFPKMESTSHTESQTAEGEVAGVDFDLLHLPLQPWEEVKGILASTELRNGEIVLEVEVRKTLCLRFLAGSMKGELPEDGEPIALLRTDSGYVVRRGRF